VTRRDKILKYIEQADHSPTVREIAKAVGLKSPATVATHLDKLEADGLIRRFGDERRIYPRNTGPTVERRPRNAA
jgi:SOS-response transcriptional repressor LexA